MDMMNKAHKGLVALMAGLAALLMASSGAEGAVRQPASPAASVCETGFRGDPAYDRMCLTRGTVGDAGVVWFFGNSPKVRRDLCAMAKRLGWRGMVHEAYGDVIGDNFRNNRQMERWVTDMAKSDCVALRYTRA